MVVAATRDLAWNPFAKTEWQMLEMGPLVRRAVAKGLWPRVLGKKIGACNAALPGHLRRRTPSAVRAARNFSAPVVPHV